MDLFALGLRLETQGSEQAKRQLTEINQLGGKIAKDFSSNFAVVGQSAQQSAATVTATYDRSAGNVHSSFDRIAHRASTMGFAVAAASEVGVSGVDRILHATTNLAFAFGSGGAIVAAVAVTGAAIIHMVESANKQMEESASKARKILAEMEIGPASLLVNKLQFGDSTATAGSPEALGIPAARKRLDALHEGLRLGKPVVGAYWGEISKLNDYLKANTALYEGLPARIDNLNLAIARNASNDAAINRILQGGKDAQEAAKRAAVKAAEDAKATAKARQDWAGKNVDWVMDGAAAEIAAKIGDPIKEALLRKAVPTAAEFTARAGDVAKTIHEDIANNRQVGDKGTGQVSKVLSGNIENATKEAEAAATALKNRIASVFSEALTNGFQAAFSGKGIGASFKAFGSSILSGLGSIFIQIGEKVIAGSALLAKAVSAISALNPWVALAAGVALVALGGVMAGGGGGGSGVGGYGSGGGSFNNSPTVTQITLSPTASSGTKNMAPSGQLVFAPTIIGPNDPAAQRAIFEMGEAFKLRSR